MVKPEEPRLIWTKCRGPEQLAVVDVRFAFQDANEVRGQFAPDLGQGHCHDARTQEYHTQSENRRDQGPGLVAQGACSLSNGLEIRALPVRARTANPRDPATLSRRRRSARRVGRLSSPSAEQFGEFRLSGAGVMEQAYRNASFRDVAIHRVPTRRRFPSLAQAMQYMKGPLPLRELMARLSEAEREQAWAEIEETLRQFVGPNGYDSPCELLIGVGTKL